MGEFDTKKESRNHVIMYMPEISKETMGANMRLGSRWVEFVHPATSLAAGLYGGAGRIMERHRHRYEFNIAYKSTMEKKGLIFSGQDESKERMDVVELPMSANPFYVGVQFHPEYKSRPAQPSPPFHGFSLWRQRTAGSACHVTQTRFTRTLEPIHVGCGRRLLARIARQQQQNIGLIEQQLNGGV